MRRLLIGAAVWLACSCRTVEAEQPSKADGPLRQAQDRPNVILVFADDQGYADLSCYGSKTIKTPNIDTLARDGRKFTSFLVGSSVCSPSRAALLTGCYPKRVGLNVPALPPTSPIGLSYEEYTIADHFKAAGYATACIGKWHLGSSPTANGFDSYYGIPFSNDMVGRGIFKKMSGIEALDYCWTHPETTLTQWKIPLTENGVVIEKPVDQRTITRRYTQKAIDFITANKSKPFFLYLAHTMPHIPLYVPDDVRDPDPKHAYINTVEHLDAEVGRLLKAVDDLNLTKKTYVIYTSDNGPWLVHKHHAGSAEPFRGGKMTTYEGGHRVPCLIRGPGIPAGTVSDGLSSTIDILPTLAEMIDKPLPGTNKIDGFSVWGLWNGTAKESPRKDFLFYEMNGSLGGIRQGDWKLKNAKKGKELYNLAKDPGEKNNLAGANPEVVKELSTRMNELDAEISRNAREPWRRQKKQKKVLGIRR